MVLFRGQGKTWDDFETRTIGLVWSNISLTLSKYIATHTTGIHHWPPSLIRTYSRISHYELSLSALPSHRRSASFLGCALLLGMGFGHDISDRSIPSWTFYFFSITQNLI